ncbi:MAG TPA: MFS transporter [Bryobacteraceae bacterium]
MATPTSDARVVFRYPNFLYHSGARVLSVLGSEMQAVAVGWQIFGLTHRPLDLGLVGLAQFLPPVLLFTVAGNTADRVPRQKILQFAMGVFAVASTLLFAFTLHGLTSVFPIYLALLLNGTARAFSQPSSQALLPTLVAEEHFPQAVAWSSSCFRTATIFGPVAGGLVYGFAGTPLPVYGVAALFSLASLALYARIHLKWMPRPAKAARRSGAMVFEGLRYVWHDKFVLGALSLDLFAVLLGGATALLPVYASDVLHVGASGLGILRSAPGLGAILTALALAHRPLGKRQGAIMLWCVFGFGLATLAFGVSRNLALSLAALGLTGAFDMVSVVVRSTMVQLRTPDHMRGRVSAVNMVFIGASNEVGQFESGITAQWFGTVPAVVVGGIGTIVVVALWTWLFPQLREVQETVAAATDP